MGEQATQQRDRDLARLSGPAGLEFDVDFAARRAQPLDEVLPLADA
jgi:hypothetical protein